LEKKVQKNLKAKIFMSSQTFFNLIEKIKIIPKLKLFLKERNYNVHIESLGKFDYSISKYVVIVSSKLTVRFLCTSKSFKKY